MAQDGLGFARVVVAVVAEEDDFAAEFRLQSPGRLDFGDQEPFREKPARLLAETDDRRGSHDLGGAGVVRLPGAQQRPGEPALNSTQAAHPMKLYQR